MLSHGISHLYDPFYLVSHLAGLGSNGQENEAVQLF